MGHGIGSTGDPNSDPEHDEPEHQEYDGPRPRKLGANTRHFPAVRTSCEGVVEGVEEKGVVAVCAGYAAHTWDIAWCGQRSGGAGGQVYNPLAVWSRASYSLGTAFADE